MQETRLIPDAVLAAAARVLRTEGEAVLRMRRALEEYRIMGVKTNIPFHQIMVESHRFLTGQFDTSFVETRFSM